MGRLVEFRLEDGSSILVEVDADTAGSVARGLSDRRGVTDQARQTFEQAVARVQPAAQALVSRLRSLADAPEEIGWSSAWSSAPKLARSSRRPVARPTSR